MIKNKAIKIAFNLVKADEDYIYDPKHEKNPGGGYHKTDKGWSKKEQGNNAEGAEWTSEQKKLDEESKDMGDGGLLSSYKRVHVAINKHTHPDTLDRLSKDQFYNVREAVAANPNVSYQTQERLSKDKFFDVKSALAGNASASPQILQRFFDEYRKDYIQNGDSRQILLKISKNPNTHHVTLDRLTMLDWQPILENVASNPNTSNYTLNNLSKNKNVIVRTNVSKNKNALPQTLINLIKDKDNRIRVQVVTHPNADKNILTKMLKDKNVAISDYAKRRLKKMEQMNELQNNFDLTKLSPELRQKVKGWSTEDINKFIGWLKKNK